MNFIFFAIILFIVSFLWALWSLKKEESNLKEIEKTKEDLMKEKILYKASH